MRCTCNSTDSLRIFLRIKMYYIDVVVFSYFYLWYAKFSYFIQFVCQLKLLLFRLQVVNISLTTVFKLNTCKLKNEPHRRWCMEKNAVAIDNCVQQKEKKCVQHKKKVLGCTQSIFNFEFLSFWSFELNNKSDHFFSCSNLCSGWSINFDEFQFNIIHNASSEKKFLCTKFVLQTTCE